MEAPAFRVPDLPPQAIRAFRTTAEAELSMPRMGARGIASRVHISRAWVFERWISRILHCDPKKIQEANCGGSEE
jgi:hypothetical protein